MACGGKGERLDLMHKQDNQTKTEEADPSWLGWLRRKIVNPLLCLFFPLENIRN